MAFSESLQKARSELIYALRHAEGQPKAVTTKLDRIIGQLESLQGTAKKSHQIFYSAQK